MEEKLFQWVDAPVLPMSAFASGLLAFALLDDHCADEAVRRGLVPKLLRRFSRRSAPPRKAPATQDGLVLCTCCADVAQQKVDFDLESDFCPDA